MLNVEESLFALSYYAKPKDIVLAIISISGCTIVFVDILRQQVAETKLLQLVPGFYLILLFGSFLFLFYYSELFFKRPIEIDRRREIGTKTVNRMQISIILKCSFLFLFTFMYVSALSLIPISLDSFRAYEEPSLENLWSLEEIINIENIIIAFLINISQIPLSAICYVTTAKFTSFSTELWKTVSFAAIVVSGIATPTVDGGTQLLFSLSIVTFYLYTLAYLNKRYPTKYLGGVSLNF